MLSLIALLLLNYFSPIEKSVIIELKRDPLPCLSDTECEELDKSRYANQCYEDNTCRFGIYTVSFKESVNHK